MKKIIQICAAGDRLYALDEDGQVWVRVRGLSKWNKVEDNQDDKT